ncbi:MAG: SBBP repeat-containing protein [Bacteroidia bacterium]
MKKLFYFTFGIFLSISSFAQIITTVAGGNEGGPAIRVAMNPYSVLFDGSNYLYFSDPNNHKISKVNIVTGIINTVAGNGNPGYSGDGGSAISARLNFPSGIALDRFGDLYIADRNNYRIRKVNHITGIITTVAGNGTSGFNGDYISALAANLNTPTGLTVDSAGNLYIADCHNHRIRKVNTSGMITTIAGNGTAGFVADGGLANLSYLYYPNGVTVDASGNLFIADSYNHRIRKVNLSTGIITTVAGNGTSGFNGDGSTATAAILSYPSSISIDRLGNLYIAGNGNRIRKVNASTGIISTVAGISSSGFGGDGSLATTASLYDPSNVTIDTIGNLYIADYGNKRIRKVNVSTGIISTIAGNGNSQFSGDGDTAIFANLVNPTGITLDASKNLYISDNGNFRIRKVNHNTGIISSFAGNGIYGYVGDGGAANSANLSSPVGLVTDKLGNLYIDDQNNNRIRKVNANTNIISNYAGDGTKSFGGDNSAATSAYLYLPQGLAIDTSGNIYIADVSNNRIRKVNASNGIISTVAGNGISGFAGDGSHAFFARLNNPTGVAVDAANNIYIADQLNHRIRKIIDNSGIISTIAGNGTAGFGGDGAEGTSANLLYPSSVAVDDSGNVYFSDNGNNRIRKVNAITGIIATVVGNGIAGFGGDGGAAILASLNNPNAIAIDVSGDLYISDYGNNRIRKVWLGVYNNSISGNQAICSGANVDSLMGTIPSGGNGIYTYTWLKSTTSANSGFIAIPSSNKTNYKPAVLTQNTWYRRYVTSGIFKDTSAAILVTVNPNPIIGFTINNPAQCLTGNHFLLVDTSRISSGTITRKWNFGNGNNDTSIMLNPNKVYSSANIYTINLKVSSNNGCKDSITKTVRVSLKPNAGFTINNPNQCSGNNFLFTDTSTVSSGKLTRKWNFGTGNNDTATSVNHSKSYLSGNIYLVKLISINNENCADSVTKTINVYHKPVAGFSVNNTSQCLTGNNFLFIDTSRISSGTITRKWNFGNGNNDTSSLLSISKNYTVANSYSVTLITTSNMNCGDTMTKIAIVNPMPIIGNIVGNAQPNSITIPFIYSVISQANTRYNWIVEKGIIQSGQGTNTVSIVWPNFGLGNLSVKVISEFNCNDSANLPININNVSVYETKNTFNLQVFPNPNNGSFLIKTNSNKTSDSKLNIVNMLGQEVWNQTQTISSGVQETQINTNLNAGIYLLRVQNENGLVIKRIVIE